MRFLVLFLVSLFCTPSGLKAGTVKIDSTNIALVVIDTNGSTIVDGFRIPGTMKIFYNGADKMNRITDVPAFSGIINIGIRGSFSASLPQKSYRFETNDASGNPLNVSLLGLPAENDWILLANYNDKTFVRAPIAYNAFLEMGHWASRSRHCEVIVNGRYMGIFTLLEKIKRDKHRVGIAEMDYNSISGNSLTGGYIFSHDNNADGDPSWYSQCGVNFIYVYPKPESITPEQMNYIKQYVRTFETVLLGNSFDDQKNGYNAYINTTSFYDYFLIGELSRNVDAYKKSSYWNKDNIADGGLLNAGPVWDFDWAFKNLNDGSNECFCRNQDGSGWAYKVEDCGWGGTAANWMNLLLEDTTFANNLHHRYFELRKNVLSENKIFAYIDSIQNLLKIPQERHYQTWPILGQNAGAPEIGNIPKTYKGEIDKLKTWLTLRLNWLDENMVGQEPATPPTSVKVQAEFAANDFRMFPNPCHDVLYIESNRAIAAIQFFSIDGKIQLQKASINTLDCYVDVSRLKNSMYILKIRFVTGEVQNTKLMIE